jgi:hypothetical protein
MTSNSLPDLRFSLGRFSTGLSGDRLDIAIVGAGVGADVSPRRQATGDLDTAETNLYNA